MKKYVKSISFFMSFLILLTSITSCTKDDDLVIENKKGLNVDELKSIHKYIKFEIEDTFYVIKNSNNIENINVGNALIKTFNTSSEEIDELEENFNKNFEKDLEYNQEYGDQALFEKYNINVDILHAFYWVKANESQGDDFIYDELLNKFNLNKNEINYLFI